MNRFQRLTLFATFGVILVLGLLGFGYALTTKWGGGFVEHRLESMLSKEIPGTLVIDDLLVTGWTTVHAPRVRFLSTKGAPVIDLQEVTMTFAPGQLLRGNIVASSAQVERGVVRIREEKDGYTDLETTFSSPGPAEGKPADVDLRSIKFDHLRLVVSFQGGSGATAEDMRGFLRIKNRSEHPGVTVQLEDVAGRQTKPSFMGMTFRFNNVNGRVQGKAEKVMDFTGNLTETSNRLGFHFQFFNREKQPVVMVLDPKHTTAGFDVRAQIAEWFAPDDLALTVR